MSRDDLAVLRADYPGYKIWREITPGRDRYVARSLIAGLNPHTVVTDDLGELRDVLEPAAAPDTVGPKSPHNAKASDTAASTAGRVIFRTWACLASEGASVFEF